jgi:hypothetical protein
MPKIQAEICCRKFLQKIAAEFAAENLGGHTKFMRLIICDRTMADVEISAPTNFCASKITVPLKFLPLLLFGLGRISNC